MNGPTTPAVALVYRIETAVRDLLQATHVSVPDPYITAIASSAVMRTMDAGWRPLEEQPAAEALKEAYVAGAQEGSNNIRPGMDIGPFFERWFKERGARPVLSLAQAEASVRMHLPDGEPRSDDDRALVAVMGEYDRMRGELAKRKEGA